MFRSLPSWSQPVRTYISSLLICTSISYQGNLNYDIKFCFNIPETRYTCNKRPLQI
ncbi:hypothetical protein FOXYSP1_09126 [Fusarium oxysporum f. sp. phaseoli]